MADIYLPTRLEPADRSTRLGMEVVGLRVAALTAGRLSYRRRVSLLTAEATNVHVNIPLRGQVSSRAGDSEPVTTGPDQGLVFSPGAPAEISWSAGAAQLCLMIPHAALEAQLEHLLGRSLRGRLTFNFQASPSGGARDRWHTVLDLIAAELDDPTDMSQNPAVARHLENLVLDGLLLGHHHNHRDAISGDRPAALRPAVARAVELIGEQPSAPWTTVGLATEVHLSVRALQEGFRRDLDTPPMQYLRQVRLRKAREVLLISDNVSTTVTSVALGVGILHVGRFAAAYRRTFGESPSETLARPT